jgi:hypothetical protein
LDDRLPDGGAALRERRERRVESRDQAREPVAPAGQRACRPLAVGDQAAQVAGAPAAQRLGGHGGLEQGRLHQRHEALEVPRAAAVDRFRQAVHEAREVLARAGSQRRQDLVELDRRRGLRERDRAALGEDRRGGRAGPQVDEEVALEEQPRAHLERGVAVQRQPGLLDRHRHDRRRAGPALDLLDLADLDARDPHR